MVTTETKTKMMQLSDADFFNTMHKSDKKGVNKNGKESTSLFKGKTEVEGGLTDMEKARLRG